MLRTHPGWLLSCSFDPRWLGERDLAEIDCDEQWLWHLLPVRCSWIDSVLGREHDPGHLCVIGEVMRGGAAALDLDVVVVAAEQAVRPDVQSLFRAVRRQITRPHDAQPAPVLAVLLPRV